MRPSSFNASERSRSACRIVPEKAVVVLRSLGNTKRHNCHVVRCAGFEEQSLSFKRQLHEKRGRASTIAGHIWRCNLLHLCFIRFLLLHSSAITADQSGGCGFSRSSRSWYSLLMCHRSVHMPISSTRSHVDNCGAAMKINNIYKAGRQILLDENSTMKGKG